jgi:hypothetical protein
MTLMETSQGGAKRDISAPSADAPMYVMGGTTPSTLEQCSVQRVLHHFWLVPKVSMMSWHYRRSATTIHSGKRLCQNESTTTDYVEQAGDSPWILLYFVHSREPASLMDRQG